MANLAFTAKETYTGVLQDETNVRETNIKAGIGASQTLGAVSTTTYKCDAIVQGAMTLAASANQELDLVTLTDLNGTAVALADVRAIIIKNTGFTSSAMTTASAASIVVGGTATGADTFVGFVGDATDSITVPTEEVLKLSAYKNGIAVPAGETKIKVTNASATEAVYINYLIAGVKA